MPTDTLTKAETALAAAVQAAFDMGDEIDRVMRQHERMTRRLEASLAAVRAVLEAERERTDATSAEIGRRITALRSATGVGDCDRPRDTEAAE